MSADDTFAGSELLQLYQGEIERRPLFKRAVSKASTELAERTNAIRLRIETLDGYHATLELSLREYEQGRFGRSLLLEVQQFLATTEAGYAASLDQKAVAP